MTKKCAKWCGGGCTQEQFDVATSTAEMMAAELGKGWTIRVWENLGWYHSVMSPSRTIKVHGGPTRGGYTAFISPPGEVYGTSPLVGHGDTPRQAVDDCVALTQAEIAKLESWLEGVN